MGTNRWLVKYQKRSTKAIPMWHRELGAQCPEAIWLTTAMPDHTGASLLISRFSVRFRVGPSSVAPHLYPSGVRRERPTPHRQVTTASAIRKAVTTAGIDASFVPAENISFTAAAAGLACRSAVITP